MGGGVKSVAVGVDVVVVVVSLRSFRSSSSQFRWAELSVTAESPLLLLKVPSQFRRAALAMAAVSPLLSVKVLCLWERACLGGGDGTVASSQPPKGRSGASLVVPPRAEAADAALQATLARCSAVRLVLAAPLDSLVPKWLLVALAIFQPTLAADGLAFAARLAKATLLLWAVRARAAWSRSARACLWARAACLLRAARRRSCGWSGGCGVTAGGCEESAAPALLQAATSAGGMRVWPWVLLEAWLVSGGRAVSEGSAAQALLQAASAAGDMRAWPQVLLEVWLVPGGLAVSAGQAAPNAVPLEEAAVGGDRAGVCRTTAGLLRGRFGTCVSMDELSAYCCVRASLDMGGSPSSSSRSRRRPRAEVWSP